MIITKFSENIAAVFFVPVFIHYLKNTFFRKFKEIPQESHCTTFLFVNLYFTGAFRIFDLSKKKQKNFSKLLTEIIRLLQTRSAKSSISCQQRK